MVPRRERSWSSVLEREIMIVRENNVDINVCADRGKAPTLLATQQVHEYSQK
jgi:hypothetical protein